MMQEDQSLLMSDSEGTQLFLSQTIQTDPNVPSTDENRQNHFNESISLSSVFNCNQIEDSTYLSFISKTNSILFTQQQTNTLKSNYVKLRNKYDCLLQQNMILRNKLDKSDNKGNIKISNSRNQMDSSKKRIINLNKNSKLVQSIHHPVSFQVLQKMDSNDNNAYFLLKDTKNLMLFEQTTKLYDIFGSFKSSLMQLQDWMKDLVDNRGQIIKSYSNIVNNTLYKFQSFQNVLQEIQIKMNGLVFQSKMTHRAYNDYKKYSNNLIQYYKLKYQQVSKNKKQNSNKYKSAGRVSEKDTTTGFKFIIPKCFLDYNQKPMSNLQKIIHDQTQDVQLISGVNQQQCIDYLKRKIQEYIKQIHSLHQLIESKQQNYDSTDSYIQNPNIRIWVSDIKNALLRSQKTKQILKQMTKQTQQHHILEQCFKSNTNQLANQLIANSSVYIQNIVDSKQDCIKNLNLFILSTYSAFSKTLITNLINIYQFTQSSTSISQWKKISMNSLRGISNTIQAIVQEVGQDMVEITQHIIKQEQEFIIRIIKYIQYLNTIIKQMELTLF